MPPYLNMHPPDFCRCRCCLAHRQQEAWTFASTEVQPRSGLRNRFSEPATRRFLVSALLAPPGARCLNVCAAPPPAWGQIKLVLRNPGLRPPQAKKFQLAGASPLNFLFGSRDPGCNASVPSHIASLNIRVDATATAFLCVRPPARRSIQNRGLETAPRCGVRCRFSC